MSRPLSITIGTTVRAFRAALVVSLFLAPSFLLAAKVETWRQDTTSAFAKGREDGVVISDADRVRLARGVERVGELEAVRVWDLVWAGDALYAATGDEGIVLRRRGDGPWETVADLADTQALALAATPDGRVFVGSGPSGQVVEVTDPKHPASRPGPDVQYIWDLATAPDGTLYAATGPAGQLWKRPAEGGAWVKVLDSPHPHLLSVAVAPDGTVYAGSDGEGLLYRVSRDGAVSVVYDAPQKEIRALLVTPDGVLYAGTAEEADGKSSQRSLASWLDDSELASDLEGGNQPRTAATVRLASYRADPPPESKTKEESTSLRSSPGGTAAPKPPRAGENVVYRVGPDGVPREIFRAKVLVYALAWQDDRLLIGTGPDGQLFEVRDRGNESAPVARLDHGQILALLARGEDLWIGAGSPGGVLRLEDRLDASGTLTSEVLDTKLLSRFGALTWKAETPPGTSVALQVRSGNVGGPDETWSAWSAPQTDPASARAEVPPGRFAQYRATLKTDNPKVSPELRAVTLRYQTANLPPEIKSLTVPDLSEGDGAARQARLTLKWEAADPNGDTLSYTLDLRKEGWPDWVRLRDRPPLTESSFAWDTTSVPAGTYRVRLTASDRSSNAPAEALTSDRVSEPFLVDHQAPTVAVAPRGLGATIDLNDDLTRLVQAEYALDGGDWVPIFPSDGLFDTPRETIALDLPDLGPGLHVLMIRATDAAGNVGSGDAVLKGP